MQSCLSLLTSKIFQMQWMRQRLLTSLVFILSVSAIGRSLSLQHPLLFFPTHPQIAIFYSCFGLESGLWSVFCTYVTSPLYLKLDFAFPSGIFRAPVQHLVKGFTRVWIGSQTTLLTRYKMLSDYDSNMFLLLFSWRIINSCFYLFIYCCRPRPAMHNLANDFAVESLLEWTSDFSPFSCTFCLFGLSNRVFCTYVCLWYNLTFWSI